MMRPITAAATGPAWEGAIAFENQETGDRRIIVPGGLRWENSPWPLIFDLAEMDHSGLSVGTVNELWRDKNTIMARGNFSDSENPEVRQVVGRAVELLSEGAVGVSMIVDDDEVDWPEEEDSLMTVKSARIRHVAIVDVPAFDLARIYLTEPVVASFTSQLRTALERTGAKSSARATFSATRTPKPQPVVAAVSDDPPREWFADPRFGSPKPEDDPRLVWQEPERSEEIAQWGAPLTIEESGRVFGHCALWNRCHVGSPGMCVHPPKEPAAYRGYLVGERIVGVPTGPLVMRTTHPPLSASPEAAQRHYHDTGAAVADVTVGADPYGIWVAGALRSTTTKGDIQALKGSALSGDWRVIGGKHRLVAIMACNAPGFRVSRAIAASGALLTTGPGCDLCDEQPSLEERVAELERVLAFRVG